MKQHAETLLVTGSSGLIGSAVCTRLAERFRGIGFDQTGPPEPLLTTVCVDLTLDSSVQRGFVRVRYGYGDRIASVIHLAAYDDFSGEPSDLYETITVHGTERRLGALQQFHVDQFLFSSTMLVHAPVDPNTFIHEDSPIAPLAVFGAFLRLWARQFEHNVYVQIGLVMLLGLSAKNGILIVEFAKRELEQGRSLREAALNDARLRLRPILMTSFAFILGCVPLWVAAGAGAVARQILGTVVITGRLAATVIGIFLVPVLFVAIERLTQRQERAHTRPRTVRAIAEGVVN